MIDNYKYKVKVAAASEPISLADAKIHLRIDSSNTDDDAYITNLIKIARERYEYDTAQCLVSSTFTLYLDYFPAYNSNYDGHIIIKKCPVTAISSIKYYDSNNELQTMDAADYDADIHAAPCIINLLTVPDTYSKKNAIEIELITGYTNAAAVPELDIQAMMFLIGHLYENRVHVVPVKMELMPETYTILALKNRVL